MSFAQTSPLIAFGVSAALVWGLTKCNLALDQPNHRSLHSRATPRSGGLGLMLGVFAAWLMLASDLHGLMLATATLMTFSFIDDVKGLSIAFRFAIHLLVVAVFFIAWPDQVHVLALLTTILATVWMVNLYNFMDGADGLAGGMAVIGFGFYAFSMREYGVYSLAAASVAMASLGFLVFNFHPAKIFLGDSGSVPLGFLAAAFGYIGWTQAKWPLWYPVLIFSPFIVDSSLTLLKRIGRRERIWQAHRDHYYQRLILMGWGHRKTALAGYGLMLVTGLMATIALAVARDIRIMVFVAIAALYCTLASLIDINWARHLAMNRDSNEI